MPRQQKQTALLTALAMLAFASNSLLNRYALNDQGMDPLAFAIIRLAAGAIFLYLFLGIKEKKFAIPISLKGMPNALGLFFYAVPFSWAYISLSAATGALLLFGSVQITLLLISRLRGDFFSLRQLGSLALAFSGILYLLYPGLTSPDPIGATLMIIAGISWGYYTYLGRGIAHPIEATRNNFIYAALIAAIMMPLVPLEYWHAYNVSQYGTAILSGAITSGLGYVLWYHVLPQLAIITAGIAQLSVPIITALAAILFLGEALTIHFMIASTLTLGGIYWGLRGN